MILQEFVLFSINSQNSSFLNWYNYLRVNQWLQMKYIQFHPINIILVTENKVAYWCIIR